MNASSQPDAPRPAPPDETWLVRNTRLDAPALAQHNSVFTVSNGYLGLSGNLPMDRDGRCPVTLIHGIYDELDMFGLIRASARPRPWLDERHFDAAGPSPAVANLPSPLLLRVFVADRELSLARVRAARFEQTLDLTCGVYAFTCELTDASGRTTRVEMSRFASIVHAHRVFMRCRVTPLNHDAAIRIVAGIDGGVRSNTTGQRQFVVTDVAADPSGRCRLAVRTPARGHEVRILTHEQARAATAARIVRGVAAHDAAAVESEFVVPAGTPIELARCLVLCSSEDARHGIAVDPEAELDAARRTGFDAALDEQRRAWRALWERADVRIDGDPTAQRGMRFCLYHLLAAAPRFSRALSVPVKLLTGEYYQGNTFYDTDLYIVPFYTFTHPQLARTCLDFRVAGLEEGRRIARALGFRGAKFAWQAGPRGEECLGDWYRFTHTNVHINADVAYALMQYVRATGDADYLARCGVDVLVETARFYASRAVRDASDGSYDLHHVAGPDEAHCDSSSNFYTNYLAGRNLRWAADVLEDLRRRRPDAHDQALRRLALAPHEPEEWRRVADRLKFLYDPATRLYEQCAGFFRLEPPPAGVLEDRRDWFVPLYRYQAMNQPDVLMALALFRDDFERDVLRSNWDYYFPRSMNFSSMSFAVHALLAAELDLLDVAYQNFIISACGDLDESLTGRGDTHAGLHGTACGGAWLAAVFGFGGVCLSQRGLRIDPRLPRHWERLSFTLDLGGSPFRVAADHRAIALESERPAGVDFPIFAAGRRLGSSGPDGGPLRVVVDRAAR